MYTHTCTHKHTHKSTTKLSPMGIQTSSSTNPSCRQHLPMKRTTQAPEGIRRVPQPHGGQHHKSVRLLYGSEFQLENMPKIIKRGLQDKSSCWVTLWENYSLCPNILSITLDQISGCHSIFVWLWITLLVWSFSIQSWDSNFLISPKSFS